MSSPRHTSKQCGSRLELLAVQTIVRAVGSTDVVRVQQQARVRDAPRDALALDDARHGDVKRVTEAARKSS